jgi:3-oxoadipate enol-lactonase
MPFARAPDGTQLYYEVIGVGEPLLLIAGRRSDHHLWNLVRGDLAKHYRVIVYDQRGTGQSDKPHHPPYSMAGFAQDAIAILDQERLSCAHVYGCSMGGAVAQWLGITHASRVGALVLACSSPGKTHGVRPSLAIQARLAQPNAGSVLDTFFARRRALPRFFLSMRDSARYPMPAYAEQFHDAASQEHDAWEQLPSITAPTLILHGSDDPIVPVANAYALAAQIPGATLCLIPKGRHMFFIEFRAKVNRIVEAFLTRHPLDH